MADTRVSVQLNVDNVFNTRYFESLSGTHTVNARIPAAVAGLAANGVLIAATPGL
jgi:outer membrane receptor protein involved in Fe transport